MNPPSPKIVSLESLRGLAALAVALGHLQLAFYPTLGQDPSFAAGLADYANRSSRTMVAIFFVLSGFVLARSYLLTGNPEALNSAAVRRFPRLAIPVLAAALVAHALHANGLMFNREATAHLATEGRSGPGWWLDTLYDFPASRGFAIREALWGVFFSFDVRHTYNINLWTMPSELLGSFVVFGCLGVYGRGRALLTSGSVLALVCVLNGWPHVALFLAGMLLSELHRLIPARLPLAVALALVAGCLWFGGHRATHTLTLPLTGVAYEHNVLFRYAAAVVLVAAIAFSPALDRALAARPLAFLGKVSFGLYLIHAPLLASVFSYQYLALRAAGWGYSQTIAAVVLTYVPTVILAGYLMTLFADRPAIWLSRVIYDKGFRPTRGAADTPAPVRGFARLFGRRSQPLS